MQATKVLCLAVFAFAAFANCEAATLGFRNENAIKNAVDAIASAIQANRDVYEEALHSVVGDAVKHLREELAQALKHVEQTVADVKKVIEYLQSQRGNIKDCLTEQLPKIAALMQETQETQTACVAESIEEIQAVAEKLLADLAEDRENVQGIIAAIQACKDRDCLKENGGKLIEAAGVVKQKARAAFDEVAQIVESNSPAAIECIQAASENFNAEIRNIHADMVACIKA